ncbi:MAG: UvrD-helicase domain-containing protein [Anaerolineales bacterium]
MKRDAHPILKQMKPSPEQWDPIVSRGSDVVVTAGAGTGKTRTLVARYLSLLVEGLPMRSIVAITFTKKAAREMRNRVREEIRTYLENEDLDEMRAKKWYEVYDNLDAARISTIHTLSADILRHHPAESVVDPAFEMLEEGEMALLRSRAVEEAMGWAVDNPQTVTLFTEFGARELRNILRSLIDKRLDLNQTLGEGIHNLWSVWKKSLLDPVKRFLEDPVVLENFHRLSQLKWDGTLQGAKASGDNLAPILEQALDYWDRIQKAKDNHDWDRVSWYLAPLQESLKQKGRKENWAPAHPKKWIGQIQEVYDQNLESLVDKGMDLSLDRRMAQEILPALFRLYRKTLDVYTDKKVQSGSLDFDDLEEKVLSLLKENWEVRSYWQKEVQALLVDEFQDTNHRQRDLLGLLNGDQGKLFIVGDGKQSIYRFRGADVGVFYNETERVHSLGEGFHLATSYRAHEGLIAALNKILEPVLGGSESDRAYVAPFEPLQPYRKQPRPGIKTPFIEFHLSVGSKAEGALERSAGAIAERLRSLVEGVGEKSASNSQPALGYGDMAVLCRASGSFPAYESAFESAGIPFLIVSGRGFYERPEVRDLLNALRAFADPFDDLALAGLLRSPVAGLSDFALYALRKKQHERGHQALYDLLKQDTLSFLGKEEDRAYRIRTMLHNFHEQIGRLTVAQVLKRYLDRSHYVAALLRSGQNRGIANVAKLLADAHQSGMVSVSRFLAYIEELQSVSVREGGGPTISSGAVQIMTVHQAKGLEFPVVVIGDVSRRDPHVRGMILDDLFQVVLPTSEEKIVLGQNGEKHILDAGSAAYRLAKQREEDEESAESDRLLYVASTRAQEKLLFSGILRGLKKDHTPYRLSGWLGKIGRSLGLHECEIEYDENGVGINEITLHDVSQSIACYVYEPEAGQEFKVTQKQYLPDETLPNEFPLCETVPGFKRIIFPDERERERQVWRVVPDQAYKRAPSWLVGNLVHWALAAWFFPDHQGKDFGSWAREKAYNSGLIEESIVDIAVQNTREILERFQESVLYRKMNGAEKRVHEIPFSVPGKGGDFEQGVIDALYQEGETWVLVEYKTDKVIDRHHLDELLQQGDYINQVGRYIKAVEVMFNQRPQPVLCFLNYKGSVYLVQDAW